MIYANSLDITFWHPLYGYVRNGHLRYDTQHKVLMAHTTSLPTAGVYCNNVVILVYVSGSGPGTHAMGITTGTSTSNRVLFLLLIILTYPGWWRRNVINFHPIDMLIYEAKVQHDQYRADMTRSHSLEGAVAQYRQRYLRNPPPSFDIWYQYAINRSSLIIENYDQIYNDLFRLLLEWGQASAGLAIQPLPRLGYSQIVVAADLEY